jgi:hypothetical protein
MGFVYFVLGWFGFGTALFGIGVAIATRERSTGEGTASPVTHGLGDAFMLGVTDPTARGDPGVTLILTGALIAGAALAALALVAATTFVTLDSPGGSAPSTRHRPG